MMPFGHPISTLEQRLDFLRENPELWRDARLIPLDHGTYRYFLEPSVHRKIAQAMKDAGLFSQKTYVLDIPVNKLVRAVRGLR